MSIYKRGTYYWIDVKVGGTRVRQSTKTDDQERAAEMHAATVELLKLRHRNRVPPAPAFDVKKRLGKMRDRSKRSGLPCDITEEELAALLRDSKGLCAVTGLPFSNERLDGASKAPFAPSVDRIDREKGYTAKNCRIVCHAVNVAMNEWGEDVFGTIARAFVELRFSGAFPVQIPHRKTRKPININDLGALASPS